MAIRRWQLSTPRGTLEGSPPHVRMRRLLIGFLCSCVLASCVPQGERLPVEDVLARAARTSQQLESALFTGDVAFEMTQAEGVSFEGSALFNGVLQNRGEHIHVQADVSLAIEGKEGPQEIEAALQIITVSPSETYLRLDEIDGSGDAALLPPALLEGLKGQWWLMPSEEGTMPEGTITPDPKLLQAQSNVVAVVEEFGFSHVNGKRTYHYATVIDPEKLTTYFAKLAQERGEEFDATATLQLLQNVQANGELWVDAKTFVVHRVRWQLNALPVGEQGEGSVSFTIEFTDHDEAPEIEMPSDTLPLTLSLPGASSESMIEGEMALPPDVEDALMQHMIDEGFDPSFFIP